MITAEDIIGFTRQQPPHPPAWPPAPHGAGHGR
jgi:hypothetical protein